MNPKLTFDSLIWLPLAVALSGAVALGCVAAYVALARQPLPRAVRAALIVLRTVSLAMVVLLLLRPAWLVEQTLREKLGLLLLADASQSMAIQDGPAGQTRLQVARKILQSASTDRQLLQTKYDYREIAFGRDISSLSLDSYKAEARLTAIGDALARSLEQVTAGTVAGVILLSDGANNSGRDPEGVARELGARKVPVHAVAVGEQEIGSAIRDVKVTSILVSPTAFARNTVPVEADLAFVSCKGQKVSVSLLVGDQTVAEKEISVGGADVKSSVQFTFVPETIGPQRISVSAKPVKGEIVTTNNTISTYIHILGGGLKAFYVDRPRAEFKFLRQAFATSKDVQLSAIATLGEKVETPKGAGAWRQYDAVVFGDVPSSAFSRNQLAELREAVSRYGVGFGMIAGTRNFSAGDYGATPVADLLPVALTIGEPEKQFEGEYRLQPSLTGDAHFIFLLENDAEANKKAWSLMRPLAGGIRLGEPKPGAETLAMGPDNQPILVVQRFGKGRTMAFAADSTWRWALAEQDTAKYHHRFWRQALLWLGSKENLGRASVWINLQSVRVVKGEQMEINANVQDSVGKDIPNAKLQAQVTPPEGAPGPLAFKFSEDHYTASYCPEVVGDYAISLKAFGRDGSPLGEDSARFIAYAPDVELESPAANHDGLKKLAEESGGEFYLPAEAGRVFKDFASRESTIEIKRTEPQPLWGSRWILYTFLAALTLEWIVRKIHRLV